jgi:hypothetical protein
MVQKFYNRYEERFPILDNLERESDGITLGFETERLGLIDDFAEFARFLLLDISWGQFLDFTGKQTEGQPPKWDLDKIEDSPQFLVDCIPRGDPLRTIAEEAVRQNKFKLRPSQLTKDELQELCDYRMLRSKRGEKAVELCPRADETTGKGIDMVYDSMKAVDPKAKRFSIYLYGHTHKASTDPMTFEKPQRSPWPLTVINTGAFQRVVNKDQLETIKEQLRSQGGEDRDILTTLKPEDLPACYTFVRIDPSYAAKKYPSPSLKKWVKGIGGKWMQNEKCVSP